MAQAYCSPMRDAVSKAMRMLSVEPLIDGVPVHCATAGIVLSGTSVCELLKVGVRSRARQSLLRSEVIETWKVALGV